MAYDKQTWTNGASGQTPVEASRLAHIEDGVAAAHDLAGLDTTSTLSSINPPASETRAWPASRTKAMILGLINDQSTTAGDRTWSAQRIVQFVQQNANGGGSGGGTVQAYEIPTSSWVFYAPGASEALRLSAIQQNTTTVRNAILANPGVPIAWAPNVAPAFQLNFNEILDSTLPKGLRYELRGTATLVPGTLNAADDTRSTAIPAAPVFSLTRAAAGSAFTPSNLRPNVQIGPNNPNSGSVFSAQVPGFDVTTGMASRKTGDVLHLCSQNSYEWASRAGYSSVYMADIFPVSGILITVTGYSLTALNTAAGNPSPAIASLERRVIKGQSSNTTALVQGDIAGAPQVIVNSTSGDFTSGENLLDQATGAVVGTFGGATVLLQGFLDQPYSTNPTMRPMYDAQVDLSGLRVVIDADPDAVIPSYNRTDAVYLAGVNGVLLEGRGGNLTIDGGYGAGIVLRSCYNVVGKAKVSGLPNHAIETTARENAYGYGVRLLGTTKLFDIEVDADTSRHAQTTNGIGATWNRNERTGSTSGSPDLCTNFWNHGPGGRVGVWSGRGVNMLATCWDTHEGAQDMVYFRPVAIDPFSAARSTTAPDGMQIRGFNIHVVDPWFRGCRIGVYDLSGPLGSTGLSFTNRLLGGVVEDYQLYGYMQSENVYKEALAAYRIKGTTFRADPTIPSTLYQQAGMLLRKGNTKTRDVTIEANNYVNGIRHTSYVDPNGLGSDATGIVRHSLLDIDWAQATGSRNITIESDYATLDVTTSEADVNPVAGTQKPLYWFLNTAGSTPVRYRSLIPHPLSSTKTPPQLASVTGGSPTFARISDYGETASGHDNSVQPTLAAQTAAGTGPTVALASGSTDSLGEVRVTMGTGPTSGAFVRVNYGTGFGSTPFPQITPALNSHTRALGLTTYDATGFTVQFGNTPTASTEYRFTYAVSGV